MAAARGIPQVTFAFSGALSDPLVQGIVDAVADSWDAEGLVVPPDAGLYTHLYLHRFPPAFGAAPTGPTVRFIRPVGFDGGGDAAAPDWVSGLGTHRPAVYVTLGTVVSGPAQWAELLAALGSLDVDAVATTGRQLDPAGLGPVPDNVRVSVTYPSPSSSAGSVPSSHTPVQGHCSLGPSAACLSSACRWGRTCGTTLTP